MNNFFRRLSMETLDVVLHIMRVRLHISGEEILPEKERFLLIGNHMSVFDPMIAMYTFREKEVAFVSKKENMDIPFIGRLMAASGCVALDRENNRSAIKSIKQAAMNISENIASMGIYPEGKINKTDKLLLPFHSGSFKIAKKSDAPIVVTTMRNTERLCKRFWYSATDIYLDIIAVITPEEHHNMKTTEISDLVREIMYEHLSDHYIRRENTDTEFEEVEAVC
jgi:1-acyl-sn-glycerol-3-phosphate acyltransferase